MLRVFQNDIQDPKQFVITLELVPGREASGRAVDTVIQIASDAFKDGRISAVSITDNPGGNPSLSPDVIGHEIFKTGMDVIVHFTCRDMNRVGMESRALQLAMMGMKNILALNGDFAGKGFGGQGAPVFDLDSVNLQCMLGMLNERLNESGDPDGFFTGCAVSPFKSTEDECFAQYAKLCRKVSAGARFIITQLGYDLRKFRELLLMEQHMDIHIPALASVYVLTPKSAEIMNKGRVPGAVVSDHLLGMVKKEWTDPDAGKMAAIDRAAQLGVVLKGIGYRGIHIGGIHKNFDTAARILDRMAAIESRWQEFENNFDFSMPGVFYMFPLKTETQKPAPQFGVRNQIIFFSRVHFYFMKFIHRLFFNFDNAAAPFYEKICKRIDNSRFGHLIMHILEDPLKILLLGCMQCGDCGIQHVAFQCPESGCPKHTRNGACGGSLNGRCEVRPDHFCVWCKAYKRLACVNKTGEMASDCVPPRMWELFRTSSWLNFHLRRDHQSTSGAVARFCTPSTCRIPAPGNVHKQKHTSKS